MPAILIGGLAVLAAARIALGIELPAAAKTIQEAHAAALLRLQSDFKGRCAELYEQYASALDAVQRQFTAKGDLDGVLAIRKEQEAARQRHALSFGVGPR